VSGEGWLSDHLLGEATESDAAEARRRLDRDPALRERAARLAEVAGRLEGLSPAAWEVTHGEREPAAHGARTSSSRRRWFVSPVLAATLAAVALAIGIGVGALVWGGRAGGGPGAPAVRTVALRPLPGSATNATGSARVTSRGQLTLRVQRLPAAGRGRYYEAWLMTDDTHLVPVASFEVHGSGSAALTVPLPAPVARYRYVDVSLQTVSGTTAHSSDSVLRGPTGG
jgi:Anti-sigma-K factor rskA